MEDTAEFQDWELLHGPDTGVSASSPVKRDGAPKGFGYVLDGGSGGGIRSDYFVLDYDKCDDRSTESEGESFTELDDPERVPFMGSGGSGEPREGVGHAQLELPCGYLEASSELSDKLNLSVESGQGELVCKDGARKETGMEENKYSLENYDENQLNLSGNGSEDVSKEEIVGATANFNDAESNNEISEDLGPLNYGGELFCMDNLKKKVEEVVPENIDENQLNLYGNGSEDVSEGENLGADGDSNEVEAKSESLQELESTVSPKTSHQKEDLAGRSYEINNSNNCSDANVWRTGTVWWKVPFELVKFCVLRVKPVWSISIAAALMGLFMLSRRLYKMKRTNQRIPVKLSIEDKKAPQLVAARLNETFKMVRRVPVIKASLTTAGVTPWPALALS